MILSGTPACMFRDNLIKHIDSKKITIEGIRDNLCKIEIPDWLKDQILEMANFRKNDRAVCPIELAMLVAVNYHISNETKLRL